MVGAFFQTYIIIHLWSNTIGLTVLFVLDNVIKRTLIDRGYTTLPITSSDKIRKYGKGVLRFFIPFYYCIKGIDLVSDTSSFNSIINEKIKSGEVMPVIKKERKVEEEKIEINIEPLPMVQSYKAVSNGKSLYTAKRENFSGFDGELIKPEEDLISPFSKKKNISDDKNHIEDELFEYITSLSDEEFCELMKTMNAFGKTRNFDITSIYKASFEKKEAL